MTSTTVPTGTDPSLTDCYRMRKRPVLQRLTRTARQTTVQTKQEERKNKCPLQDQPIHQLIQSNDGKTKVGEDTGSTNNISITVTSYVHSKTADPSVN